MRGLSCFHAHTHTHTHPLSIFPQGIGSSIIKSSYLTHTLFTLLQPRCTTQDDPAQSSPSCTGGHRARAEIAPRAENRQTISHLLLGVNSIVRHPLQDADWLIVCKTGIINDDGIRLFIHLSVTLV